MALTSSDSMRKKQPENAKHDVLPKWPFEKGHFVRVFGLCSKTRRRKKSTVGLFPPTAKSFEFGPILDGWWCPVQIWIFVFSFLYFLLCIFAIYGWGKLFLRLIGFLPPVGIDPIYNWLAGLSGIVVLSIIASFAHFLIPINTATALAILLSGVLAFFANRKVPEIEADGVQIGAKRRPPYSLKAFAVNLKFAIGIHPEKGAYETVAFAILCFLFTQLLNRNYDTGLYHLSWIQIIRNEPLPLGIANLHGRLGFQTSWFSFATLVEPPRIISNSPTAFANPLLLFFYGSGVLDLFKARKKKVSNSPLRLFLAFTILPATGGMFNFVPSSSPDYPAMLFTFLAIFLVMNHKERWKEIPLNLIIWLLSFLILLKLSSAIALVMAAIALVMVETGFWRRSQTAKPALLRMARSSIIPFLVLFPAWLLRGYLISGAPFYPSTFLRIDAIPWSVNIGAMRKEALDVVAWARLPGPHYLSSLVSWDWIVPWSKEFITKQFLFWGLFAAGVVLIFAKIRKGGAFWRDSYSFGMLIIVPSLIFWFFSAPDPRFAYGVIFSSAILLSTAGLFGVEVATPRIRGKMSYLAWMSVFIAALAVIFIHMEGLHHISLSESEYFKNRVFILFTILFWSALFIEYEVFRVSPRRVPLFVSVGLFAGLFAFVHFGELGQPMKIVRSHVALQDGLWVPVSSDQCFDHPMPCTPVPSRLNIKELPGGRHLYLERDE